MKRPSRNLMNYAWTFLIVGFLTTAGSMLTLSKGFLFNKYSMNEMILPAINLFIAGPCSLISGFLLIDKYKRGIIFGLVTSGLFIFCSITFLFQSLYNQSQNSIWNLLPAFIGISIAFGFIVKVMKFMRHI
jgi:hypothetical protein